MQALDRLPPESFGVEIQDRMKHAWKLAIKEATRIQEHYTPRGKLQQLQKVIEIISLAYELYNDGRKATADDLVVTLPYILVKAKIDRLLSHYNYIRAFHYSVDTGDQISVV